MFPGYVPLFCMVHMAGQDLISTLSQKAASYATPNFRQRFDTFGCDPVIQMSLLVRSPVNPQMLLKPPLKEKHSLFPMFAGYIPLYPFDF